MTTRSLAPAPVAPAPPIAHALQSACLSVQVPESLWGFRTGSTCPENKLSTAWLGKQESSAAQFIHYFIPSASFCARRYPYQSTARACTRRAATRSARHIGALCKHSTVTRRACSPYLVPCLCMSVLARRRSGASARAASAALMYCDLPPLRKSRLVEDLLSAATVDRCRRCTTYGQRLTIHHLPTNSTLTQLRSDSFWH